MSIKISHFDFLIMAPLQNLAVAPGGGHWQYARLDPPLLPNSCRILIQICPRWIQMLQSCVLYRGLVPILHLGIDKV